MFCIAIMQCGVIINAGDSLSKVSTAIGLEDGRGHLPAFRIVRMFHQTAARVNVSVRLKFAVEEVSSEK
jgi:hypothetical protein